MDHFQKNKGIFFDKKISTEYFEFVRELGRGAMFSHLRRYVQHFNSGRYNYLLVFLIIFFAFRPYNRGIEYLTVWKTLFTCTLLMAIFNCKHRRKVKMLSILLAIPTVLLSWLEFFYQVEACFVLKLLFTISFLVVCLASIFYDVLLSSKVTIETLRGVVCAYFMIAFVFAFAYYLIEYFLPGSFRLITRDVSFVVYSRNLSEMMYFSFVTLLTIGFGDITPLGDIAQTLVVIEGIIGQFYVAILVARLVLVYSSYVDKKRSTQRAKKIKN
jgi:voltage-gated potassium channel